MSIVCGKTLLFPRSVGLSTRAGWQNRPIVHSSPSFSSSFWFSRSLHVLVEYSEAKSTTLKAKSQGCMPSFSTAWSSRAPYIREEDYKSRAVGTPSMRKILWVIVQPLRTAGGMRGGAEHNSVAATALGNPGQFPSCLRGHEAAGVLSRYKISPARGMSLIPSDSRPCQASILISL